MPIAGQKLAFVMASSNHGTMIVNRFDYRMVGPDRGYGVGFRSSKRPLSIQPKSRSLSNCWQYDGGTTATG
jgi:hypothetical protein